MKKLAQALFAATVVALIGTLILVTIYVLGGWFLAWFVLLSSAQQWIVGVFLAIFVVTLICVAVDD